MGKEDSSETGKKVDPRYLYVEARGWLAQETSINGDTVDVLEGPISFDSIIVRATDDTEAYQLGAAKLSDRQADDPEMFDQESANRESDGPIDGSHASGQFLNDYVVRL